MIASIFIVYCLVSAILLAFLTKGHKNEWFFKLIIVLFLPIIGWFLPSIWPKRWIKHDETFFANYMRQQSEEISIQFLTSQEKVALDSELNVVPIEEALIVSDYTTRRKVLIDILKHDAIQYIDVLKTAVVNEDTETSHYAVTAVIEVKRELTILLQKLAVEYAENPTDAKIAYAYADVIVEYLHSGFLDTQSKRHYELTYIQVLHQLIETNQASEKVYADKISIELAIGDLISAKLTTQQFKERHPLCEDAFLSAMSVYFATSAYDKLQQELQQLKNSPITLSNHALKIVRYWTGVKQHNEVIT